MYKYIYIYIYIQYTYKLKPEMAYLCEVTPLVYRNYMGKTGTINKYVGPIRKNCWKFKRLGCAERFALRFSLLSWHNHITYRDLGIHKCIPQTPGLRRGDED